MASEPRKIKGPCFDCEGGAPERFCWCLVFNPHDHMDTAPTPKQPDDLRPNVPPRMMS